MSETPVKVVEIPDNTTKTWMDQGLVVAYADEKKRYDERTEEERQERLKKEEALAARAALQAKRLADFRASHPQ